MSSGVLTPTVVSCWCQHLFCQELVDTAMLLLQQVGSVPSCLVSTVKGHLVLVQAVVLSRAGG